MNKEWATKVTVYIGIALLCYSAMSFSNDRYFLCGPDEDGCPEGDHGSCFCIPYNEMEANGPYCLDFNDFTCIPESRTMGCDSTLRYKNQGECLATIFQSEPLPPCTVTTKSFCLEHEALMCDEDGTLNSCH